jgi:putative protease
MEETRPGEYLPVYEDEGGTYILNSKDLCMLEYIPELVSAGVTGFKIEGRMKSAYYAAAVVKAYREAIDGYFESPALYERNKQRYMEEIQKTESRGFTTGFYFSRPGPEAQVYQPCASPHSQGPSGKGTGSDFAAVALDYDAASGCALVEQRNKFWRGETLEIFSHSRPNREQVIATMTDEQGVQLENAPHPRQKIRIKVEGPVLPMDILRRNHKC